MEKLYTEACQLARLHFSTVTMVTGIEDGLEGKTGGRRPAGGCGSQLFELMLAWTEIEAVPMGKSAGLRKNQWVRWAGSGTDWTRMDRGKEPSGWD